MCLKMIVFCAQVFLIQNILGQCIGDVGSYNLGNSEVVAAKRYDLSNFCGCSNAQWPSAQVGLAEGLAASFGGSLNVQTSSPIAPGSISILSENQIQGPVSVSGTLPFLSAVALEGSLPTRGFGEVSYQIGNGRVGILQENCQDSYVDSGTFGGNSDWFGTGWNLAGSGFNGINSCVNSEPTTYGWNANRGFGCNCLY